MNAVTKTYDMFARLLAYPTAEPPEEGYATWDVRYEKVGEENRIDKLDSIFHDSPHLREYNATIQNLSLAEMEELYTRTFDINPIASLEVGWHLFGEQYERGAFLVKMRQSLHAHFIEESTELPDHLTHVLCLMGRLERAEADEFAVKYLLPSLKKILEGFTDAGNPYKGVLEALRTFVEEQHVAVESKSAEGVSLHE